MNVLSLYPHCYNAITEGFELAGFNILQAQDGTKIVGIIGDKMSYRLIAQLQPLFFVFRTKTALKFKAINTNAIRGSYNVYRYRTQPSDYGCKDTVWWYIGVKQNLNNDNSYIFPQPSNDNDGAIDNDVLLSLNVAISILEVLDYTSNHHIEFNKFYKF